MSDTEKIKLPLAYSSHRQIVDAEGNLVIQVCSGGPGIEAADQLQDLVVVACNSFEKLLAAAKAAEAALARQKWIDTGTDPEAIALRQLREAIAAAGAA
jgi:hypothetical protein